MLIWLSPDYRGQEKLINLYKDDRDAYVALLAKIPGWPGEPKHGWDFQAPIFVGDEGLRALAQHGITVELKPHNGDRNYDLMLTRLQDRIAALELEKSADNAALQYSRGAAVAIHIPDQALLMIDSVTWLEDACTQELQSHLDQGWRILAVCPPNAQRRPDYILGRRKALL